MNIKIACIGSGNMGFALMKGAAGILKSAEIGFTDTDAAKAKAAADALGGAWFMRLTLRRRKRAITSFSR
jgi:pyrroline-5-carboxylate reductase